jgi:hypothetical protein
LDGEEYMLVKFSRNNIWLLPEAKVNDSKL